MTIHASLGFANSIRSFAWELGESKKQVRGTTQAERTHLIRKELTQSLGLFKNSWEHSDSIFYEGWTTTDKYGLLDEPTIRLLYQPQLEPCMNQSQVRSLYPPTD